MPDFVHALVSLKDGSGRWAGVVPRPPDGVRPFGAIRQSDGGMRPVI
jgi:hypothetical protein